MVKYAVDNRETYSIRRYMQIRHLIVVICASLFIAWGLPSAEPADSGDVTTYWVLSSYTDPEDAFQERDRVESATGMTIFVVRAMVDDVQRYRLLVKTAATAANRELQEMNLGFYGISDIWTIDLTQPVADVEVFAADIAAAEEEAAEPAVEERALPPSEIADVIASYWVLSRHPDLQEAFDERDRVETGTGMMVFVVPETVDDAQTYSLLVKAADSAANRELQQLNLELYGVTDITLLDVQGPIEAIEITETAIAEIPAEVPPPIVPVEPPTLPVETEVVTSIEVPAPVVEEEISEVEEEVPEPVVEEVARSTDADIPLQVEEETTTGMATAVPAPAVTEEIITAAADIPAPLLEEISAVETVTATPTIEEEIVVVAADIPVPVLEDMARSEAVVPTPPLTEEISVVTTNIPTPAVEEQVTSIEVVLPAPVVEEELAVAAAQIPMPPDVDEVTGVEEVIPAPSIEEEVVIVAAEIPTPPAEEEVTSADDVIEAPPVEEEVAVVEAEVPTPPVEEDVPTIEDEIPVPVQEDEVAVVEVTPVEEEVGSG